MFGSSRKSPRDKSPMNSRQKKKSLKETQSLPAMQRSEEKSSNPFFDRERARRNKNQSVPDNNYIQSVFSQQNLLTPKKRLANQKKFWVADQFVDHCTFCKKRFRPILRRKHHCRICGNIFCDKCSSIRQIHFSDKGTSTIPTETRVCLNCYNMNQQYLKDMKNNINMIHQSAQPSTSAMTTRNSKNLNESQGLVNPSQIGQDLNASTMTAFMGKNKNFFDFDRVDSDTIKDEQSSLSAQKQHQMIVQRIQNEEEKKSLTKESEEQAVLEASMRMELKDFYGETERRRAQEQVVAERSDESQQEEVLSQDELFKTHFQLQDEELLQKHLDKALEDVVHTVLEEFALKHQTWEDICTKFVLRAINSVKPSSKQFQDSIDFNQFFKIYLSEWKDTSKSQYVNGLVMKKNIANKRMNSRIENPKILVINNSLGNFDEEDQLTNLEQAIRQEEPQVNILISKIKALGPNLIIVEKQCTLQVQEKLKENGITVVMNVPKSDIKRICRLTQTIPCPSVNLINPGNFIMGKCENFRIQKLRRQQASQNQLLQQVDTEMYLEGCHPILGATICFSGHNQEELGLIKEAFQKMVSVARTIYLENEYLKFIGCRVRPDQSPFLTKKHIERDNFVVQVVKFVHKTIESDDIEKEEEVEENQVNEGFINKKMTLPCAPPRRRIIYFQRDKTTEDAEKLEAKENSHSGDNSYGNTLTVPVTSHTQQKSGDESYIKNQQSPNTSLYDGKSRFIAHGKTNDSLNVSHNATDPQLNPSEMAIGGRGSSSKKNYAKHHLMKHDMSLGRKLIEFSERSMEICDPAVCREEIVKHDYHYFHNNGRLLMKMLKMSKSDRDKNFKEDLKKFLQKGREMKIVTFQYCLKCNKEIGQKAFLSNQIFEMSHYKFLEQYFYNQDLISNEEECGHLVHVDIERIFQLGPLRFRFSFQKRETYSIDLLKIGQVGNALDKWSSVNEKVIKQVLQNFGLCHEQLLGHSRDLKYKTKQLMSLGWVKQIPELVNNLTEMQEFLRRIKVCLDKTKDEFDEFIFDNEFQNPLQINMAQKILLYHICQFMYLLREAQLTIQDEKLQNLAPAGLLSSAQGKLHNQSMIVDTKEEQASPSKYKGKKIFTNQHSEAVPQAFTTFGSAGVHFQMERQSTNVGSGKRDRRNTAHPNSIFQTFGVGADGQTQNFIVRMNHFKKMFKDNISFPPGMNRNSIKVSQQSKESQDSLSDITMITHCLDSNLYMEALYYLNYIDVKNKPGLVETKLNPQLKESSKGPVIPPFGNFSPLTQIYPKIREMKDESDVLNGKVSKGDIESELLNQENITFMFNFTNYGHPLRSMSCKIMKDDAISKEIKSSSLYISKSCKAQQQSAKYERLEKLNTNYQSLYQSLDEIRQKMVQIKNEHQSKNQGQSKNKEVQKEEFQPLNQNAVFEMNQLFNHKQEYTVKVYFATQFQTLRKLFCGAHDDFIQSLSQNIKWETSGGKKAKAFFKCIDNKYILKQVNSNEMKMFRGMAQSYFEYLCRSYHEGYPTALAKILGAFKVTVTNHKGRVDQAYLFLMENIFYGIEAKSAHVQSYDLKGGRIRRLAKKKALGQVLMDNNFRLDFAGSPLCLDYVMHYLLHVSLQNDSLFLYKQNVVDYSLLAVIDKDKKKIRVGVLDYLQQYTIDKKFETAFKKMLSQEDPTIISPGEYKQRFCIEMSKYFVCLYPDKAHNVITEMQNQHLNQSLVNSQPEEQQFALEQGEVKDEHKVKPFDISVDSSEQSSDSESNNDCSRRGTSKTMFKREDEEEKEAQEDNVLFSQQRPRVPNSFQNGQRSERNDTVITRIKEEDEEEEDV